MTPSELLDELEHATYEVVEKPWGQEFVITAGDLIFKVIRVNAGEMTSLQHHEEKDEVIFVMMGNETGGVAYGSGHAGVGQRVRIRPNTLHRTWGHAVLFEVSTNHPDDVVRHSDAYGR